MGREQRPTASCTGNWRHAEAPAAQQEHVPPAPAGIWGFRKACTLSDGHALEPQTLTAELSKALCDMQWAGSSDLQRAVRAAGGMLRHPQPNKSTAPLQRLVVGAAQAALAVNPPAAAAIAASVRQAESACAGKGMPCGQYRSAAVL